MMLIERLVNTSNYKPIEGFEDYYINETGDVIKHTFINGKEKIKTICQSKSSTGHMKVSLSKNFKGKTSTTSCLVNKLVYETFKTKTKDTIIFIDGDKTNCNLNNLTTVSELLKMYRDLINIGG